MVAKLSDMGISEAMHDTYTQAFMVRSASPLAVNNAFLIMCSPLSQQKRATLS